MKAIAAAISVVDPLTLERALASGSHTLTLDGGEQIELLLDDIILKLKREAKGELAFAYELDGSFAALDTTLTPELLTEGIARDFNRHGQDQRRTLDLAFDARITVKYCGTDRIAEAIAAHRDALLTWLQADAIERVDEFDDSAAVKVSGEKVQLEVTAAAG